jgi:NADPH:quinone reductase-like Zn-dependent oxidoreductase
MTRAVIATEFGGPEVLSVIDETVREPGPGEVLLAVRAAGTNPIDYKLFSGSHGADPSMLPFRPGLEAAGVVVAVGEGAEGPAGPLSIGDEVIAYRIDGAYADRVVVPARTVVPKPTTLSFEEAGGLLLAGSTAVHALVAVEVGSGDTVLINGASGGVGTIAVQVAVDLGARVIATAGHAGHDRLRRLGAEPVTYGEGLLDRVRALAPDGVDAALDLVGTDEALDTSLALVADRDRIATIAGFQRGLAEGIRVLGGAPGADPGEAIRDAARLQLVALAEAGKLEVPVARAYPLEEAAAALTELAAGHTHGKIVLVP